MNKEDEYFLDYIIPITCGGTRTFYNVTFTSLKNNMKKGARK
tara:strand:- start:1014 stop:1139 length:126 start_codon:yes stop_codon:yes gene_type:complete